MNATNTQLPPHHQNVLNRFVAACQGDARVVAAFLVGSYAKGTADEHSDLDLYLLTAADAYDDFLEGRAAFVRSLGEPAFLEDFDLPNTLFFIFPDGAECELVIGSEREINQIFDGPYRVLLDKKQLVAGTVLSSGERAPSAQVETLRRQIYWFWHDLSHFISAMGRGQLWWAQGQLEALRVYCVNLARLNQNFSDGDVGGEPYFKIEKVISVEQLSPLQATFCPMEPDAMLQAARLILQFYQELAPALARAHGIPYPVALERVMVRRLEKLIYSR